MSAGPTRLARSLPARRLSPRGWLPAAERVWLRRQTELQAPGPPARDWLVRRPQAPAAGRAPGPAVAAGDWQAGAWSCAVLPWPEVRLAPARALGSHWANVCRLEILPLQSWARASSGVELRRRTHLAPAAPCVGERRGTAPTSAPRGLEAAATLLACARGGPRPAGRLALNEPDAPPATPRTRGPSPGGQCWLSSASPRLPTRFSNAGEPSRHPGEQKRVGGGRGPVPSLGRDGTRRSRSPVPAGARGRGCATRVSDDRPGER